MFAWVLWRYFALKPIRRVGREVKLSRALTPRTLASAVGRGSSASAGNDAQTIGWLICALVVQGISSSSLLWSLIWTVPFTVVVRLNLYSPMKLTTVMELSGNDEIRPAGRAVAVAVAAGVERAGRRLQAVGVVREVAAGCPTSRR